MLWDVRPTTVWWKWALLVLFEMMIWLERAKINSGSALHWVNRMDWKYNLVCPVGAAHACDPPCIIFAAGTEILALDPEGGAYQPIISGLSGPFAVDVHIREGLLFWSDTTQRIISRANIDGTNASTIIDVQGYCQGLAVEWMSNLLYWTDDTHDVIEVAHLNGTNRKVLVSSDLDQPYDLIVDPRKG